MEVTHQAFQEASSSLVGVLLTWWKHLNPWHRAKHLIEPKKKEQT